MNRIRRTPDLEALIGLFYSQPERLGEFEKVSASDMPAAYHDLLIHEHHMTVTVEIFHRSPVDVRVLRKHITATHYARMILLARQSDGQVVQFGIMRVHLASLSNEVRGEIESERAPLGRILIEHDVLRRIRLGRLWRVAPGPDLAAWLAPGYSPPPITYGRTAMIDCDGQPAIELLEIVSPLDGVLQ
jgi:chorismate-pyruvate lyase